MPPKRKGKGRGGANTGNTQQRPAQQPTKKTNPPQQPKNTEPNTPPQADPQPSVPEVRAPATVPVPVTPAIVPQEVKVKEEPVEVVVSPQPPRQNNNNNGSNPRGALSSSQLSLVQGIPLAPRPQQAGTQGRPLTCFVNHYKFNIGAPHVYQYDTSFEPELERTKIKANVLQSIETLKNNQYAFDGKMLFSTFQIPDGVFHTTMANTNYSVTITQTNVLDLNSPNMPLQVYNILFKKILRLLKLEPVGRQYFDPGKPTRLPDFHIELWPGYFTRINPTIHGIVLIADLAHKVLRTDTVLDQLHTIRQNSKNDNMFRERAKAQLIGQVVLTRYNNRTYRINDIDWDSTPMSTFNYQKSKSTYLQYYRQQHHLEIRDRNQPLLLHKPRRKNADRIYLIPELCSMTGLTEDLIRDNTTMKELGKHTRVVPTSRSEQLAQFVKNVNESPDVIRSLDQWHITLNETPTQVQGRQLPPEKLKMGKNVVTASAKADWIPKSIEEPKPMHNWLLVYPQQSRQDGEELIKEINRNTRELEMPISAPIVVQLKKSFWQDYVAAIRENVTPDTDMVVCVLPQGNTTPVYNAIKTLCCVELGVPSQCVKSKTITGAKRGSICPKIVQQMNCKLGGQLWQVQIPLKGTMIVGIDVCHDTQSNMGRGNRSVVGFCASTNAAYTKYYSTVTFQGVGKEIVEELTDCMYKALDNWKAINNAFPANVIVYRDGVGEGQFQEVLNFEVPQIHESFARFKVKPNLTVVVVQKRIHTRIFHAQGRQIQNPPPGTVVDTNCVSPDSYDFYLISQHVNQGTVTPTHYRIVHNEISGLSPDNYQQLTYKLCHLYYNWAGTIRVPAPCHYAHKIAFLVGQSIHDTPSENLVNKLYFL